MARSLLSIDPEVFMGKRAFRSRRAASASAGYPTLEEFDSSRRSFLARLGAAALGAAGLALLPGCGDRSIGDEEDEERHRPKETGGAPPLMDSRVDQPPHRFKDSGGVRPDMEARLDQRPGPDAGPPVISRDATGGVAPMPDALIDEKSRTDI